MKICELCNKPKLLFSEDKYCENCKEDIELLGIKEAKKQIGDLKCI